MVKLGVKPMPVTLAIGDGANDVSMIQEAHLGVGISGKEGLQAVNSSDVAIAQFRFLTRLLLVHGRWNYRRMAFLVKYSFYKNMLLVLPIIIWNMYNDIPRQMAVPNLPGYALFNVIYAQWLCIMYACYERDCSAEAAMKFPRIYRSGITSELFNPKVFWQWDSVLCWSHC